MVGLTKSFALDNRVQELFLLYTYTFFFLFFFTETK